MAAEPWYLQSDMDHAEWLNGSESDTDPGDECDACDEPASGDDPEMVPADVEAFLAEMAALLRRDAVVNE